MNKKLKNRKFLFKRETINLSLREKCPNIEFFLVCIRIEYGDLLRKKLHKKFHSWTLFTQCLLQLHGKELIQIYYKKLWLFYFYTSSFFLKSEYYCTLLLFKFILYSERVVRRCSGKWVLLEILRNAQENACCLKLY